MLVVKCDVCGAISENAHAIILGAGTASGGPESELTGHICDACWPKFDAVIKEWLACGFRIRTQQPKANLGDLNTPVPINPQLAKRLAGR